MLSNRHRHTDTQTKYCNPRCACVPRVNKWKALKCQTLGAAVHVIVLVGWLEIDHSLVTVMLAMRIVVPAHTIWCKVRSRVSDALSQALCNLSLAFLADFTLSDSTAPIRFIVKLSLFYSQITCLPSYRYSSFNCGHTLLEAYLLPMANRQ